MRTVAYAAVLAACFGASGVALAADLKHPGSLKDAPEWSPAALWTGLYIGGHIGGARGDVDVTDTYDYAGDPVKKSAFGTSGLIGGAQVGYNIQRGSIVYGIEADIGYLSLKGSKTVDLPPPTNKASDPNAYATGTYKTSGGLYGDITGRLGYATSNSLFYLKGGLALLSADFNAHYVGENCTTTGTYCDGTPPKNPSVFDFGHSDTLVGWTIGAGIEYSLSPSLSIKAEYQHFDFGSTSLSYDGTYKFHPGHQNQCPANWCSKLHGNADVDVGVDAVTVGLNYNLSGTGDTLK